MSRKVADMTEDQLARKRATDKRWYDEHKVQKLAAVAAYKVTHPELVRETNRLAAERVHARKRAERALEGGA